MTAYAAPGLRAPLPTLLLTAVFALPGLPAAAKGALEVTPETDETYTEQIVAIADLANGTYAKIRLGISNVGPGDGQGACQLLVIPLAGATWSAEAVVEREDWRYVPEGDTLKMGPCEARAGEDGLHVVAALDGGAVEINLAAAPTRNRAHDARAKDAFYELDLLVPWSRARVRIKRGDRDETLDGFGYADHPRSTTLPRDLAKSWVRFRGLNESDPRLVLIRTPPHGPTQGWHRSKGGTSSLDRVAMRREGGGDRPAWRVRFKGPGGEWRLQTRSLLLRSAPVEEQGAVLGSMIGALIGNPVTYTYRGVLEERGTGAKIPGIVEITLTDE